MNTNTNKRKSLLATMVGLMAAGGLSTAAAQVEESARAQNVLDEIVITATRRETSLQDTAGSIAAIGSEAIDRRNLSGMKDYLRSVPSVSFIDRGAGQNAIIIRGVASDPENEADPSGSGVTTGVYFGEVPLAGFGFRGGNADLQLVDLERIEVLRGPQGTLFGSGSLGGAVRNIPKAPSFDGVEGDLKFDMSQMDEEGGNNFNAEAVINIPIIDEVLAIRAVAYKSEESGFVSNTAGSDADYIATAASFGAENFAVNKSEVGQSDRTGGRFSVLWRPMEALSVTGQLIYQEIEQSGLLVVDSRTEKYSRNSYQFGNAFKNTEGTFGGRKPFGSGESLNREGLIDELMIGNLIVEYDFGWGQLLSSSSWVEEESASALDFGSVLGNGIPLAALETQKVDAFIQEVRLASDTDGKFSYVVGVYYEDVDRDIVNNFHWFGDPDTNIFDNFYGTDTTLINTVFAPFGLEQKSVFGEFTYRLTEITELTVGGRWFDYERSLVINAEGALANILSSKEAVSEKNHNLKVNLSVRPVEDQLVYLQWAEGFRLGNSQLPISEDLCDVNNDGLLDGTGVSIEGDYDSDFVETFEIGGKLSLLDGRLSVNAAVYESTWDGLPVRVSSPGTTCLETRIDTAGEARIRGLELETAYQLTPSLRLDFSGSYTDSELTKDALSLGGNKGDRLPAAPEYNLSVAIEYEFRIANYDSYIRGDYSFVGGYYNNFKEEGLEAGDYGLINISSGLFLDNGINIGLYINNLTGEDDFTWTGNLGSTSGFSYRLRPRTAGLTVGYQF